MKQDVGDPFGEEVRHTSKEFEAASDHVAGLAARGDGQITPQHLLMFYGLYKQATVGDCQGDKPTIFNPAARSKWFAWKQLEGMDRKIAESEYVKLLKQLDSCWSSATGGVAKPSGVGGPVFSSLAEAEMDCSQV